MTFRQMQELGGPFLESLCKAFLVADYEDRAKLGKAYPDVYREYLKMVGEDVEISR